MRPTTTARRVLRTAAACAVALPAAASAQQRSPTPLDPVHVTARATRADQLDARAAAYEQADDSRRWGKAARLRERAAALRPAADPGGFTSLRAAAFSRHALGQRVAAGYLMERAGDQAMARGDVFNAADAYVDAAYIAAELRDPERVREFVGKGTLLMGSPLLSPPQRESLRGRVAQAAPRPGLEVAAAPHP